MKAKSKKRYFVAVRTDNKVNVKIFEFKTKKAALEFFNGMNQMVGIEAIIGEK